MFEIENHLVLCRNCLVLMYPMMDRGDLANTLSILGQKERIVVLSQVTGALEFLHKKIEGVRLVAVALRKYSLETLMLVYCKQSCNICILCHEKIVHYLVI